MMRMRSRTIHFDYKKISMYMGLIIFFTFLGIFTFSKTRGLWSGVTLTILSPREGASLLNSITYIEGIAPKAIKLSVNGNNTFVGEDGSFSYPIPIHIGYNEINIEAEDKFKNVSRETLRINGVNKLSNN